MNEIAYALYAVAGIILLVGAATFLRSASGKKVVATAEGDWAAVHTKLDELLVHAKLTHAAALAPVTVALVPAQPAPKPDVVPAPSSSVTDKLFGTPPAEPAPAAPAAAPDPVLDFSAPTLDFNVVRNQNILVSGTVSKKFINCPTPVWVQTINGSGSTITANGASHEEPNGQSLNRMTVVPVGGVVDVTVVCDDSGRTDLSILAAPQ